MLKPGTIPYLHATFEEIETKAAAPHVISASRATDIPAFFGAWFQKQLEQGYVKRKNPFSGKYYYISLSNAAAFVFWTKNPRPFLPFLEQFSQDFYFQYTLNNYDHTRLEPNLPILEERLITFQQLSKKYGKSRILWRFDPIMILPEMPLEAVIERIEHTANSLMGFTERLTISFLTLKSYKAARNRLAMAYPEIAQDPSMAIPAGSQRIKILNYLKDLQERWKKVDPEFTIQACAMPDDFTAYEIYPSRCIDDQLLG